MSLFALVALLLPPQPFVKPGWSGSKDATGRRVGVWVRHAGARRAKIETASYDAAGRRHGVQQAFDAKGASCWKGEFTHGTGILERYTADCRLKTRTPLKDGRVHGKVEQFDRNRRPVTEVSYRFGFPHGPSKRLKYPTNAPPKATYKCMYAGYTIWRSVHGGPVDDCAVDTIAGIGVKRSPLFRRTIKGVKVEHIFSKGPAVQSGLKVGDVIVAIGKTRLPGPGPEAMQRSMTGPAGTTVTLVVRRDGKEVGVPIKRQMLDLEAWKVELEAAALAQPKGPVKLLNVPEPRFPGRGR